jgi:plastocyanin
MSARAVAGLPALLVMALAPVGCSSSGAGAAGPATSASPSGDGGTVTVTIKDFTFEPTPVTVHAGQRITFANQDDSPHEPTAGRPTQQTGTFTVDTAAHAGATTDPIQLAPGTYDYYCALHEYMVATITVS